MKEQITIRAEPRKAQGSTAARRARRAGHLPGVVYGEGKPAMAVQVPAHEFEKMLHRHTGEHLIMDLVIGGETKKVLLQELQRNPLTGHLMHVDFHEISMTKKLRVEVPITLVGTPVGVSQQGGILDHLLRRVEIECLPADIPEQIEVDVSGLEVGKHLSVRDIRLDPARYAVITAGDIAIAAVSMPKAEEEAAPAAAAGEAAAEPEVLTEKKAEEGEAAGEAKEAKETKEAKKETKEASKEKEKGGKEKAEK